MSCSPDTGDETNHLYGQVVCFTDGTVAEAKLNTGTPEIQPFEIGGTRQGINMPDNIAFQPDTNNAILHEDAETTSRAPHNNDLWGCLPDGQDQDLLSDGCVRVATLNDLTAEWTGGTSMPPARTSTSACSTTSAARQPSSTSRVGITTSPCSAQRAEFAVGGAGLRLGAPDVSVADRATARLRGGPL